MASWTNMRAQRFRASMTGMNGLHFLPVLVVMKTALGVRSVSLSPYVSFHFPCSISIHARLRVRSSGFATSHSVGLIEELMAHHLGPNWKSHGQLVGNSS